MITGISRILFVSLMVVSSLSASWADSAREMLAAGRVDDAIADLNVRLSSAPSDAESSNLLCRAYYEIEDWDRAESSCRKAASLDPSNSHFHLWLGRVYGEKADRAGFLGAAGLAGKTRTEFERAVQLDPRNLEARLDLTEFYVDAPSIVGGGEQKARAQAQSIATMNPAREHWVYAIIAEQKKDMAAAEKEYRQYIDLSHGDAEAWMKFGVFLRHQKRLDEMEQAMVKVNHAPATKPDALVEAAGNLYRAGRGYPLATELLHRYLSVGPVEAAPAFKAHHLLGLVLEKQGDKTGAAREYEASLKLARNFRVAQQSLNRVAH